MWPFKKKQPPKCEWMTEDGWGYGNKWYCTTHGVWFPEQVFMHPPAQCQVAAEQGGQS